MNCLNKQREKDHLECRVLCQDVDLINKEGIA